MDDFLFLRPWWLLLLIPSAVIVMGLLRASHAATAWRGVISKELLPHLVVGGGKQRRFGPTPLLALWLFLGTLALAGPSFGREPAPFTDDSASLVIVVKSTPSMETKDVAPSRMARAIQKVRDLLATRDGARTALLAYSGSAHVVMPLTKDPRVTEVFAEKLGPGIMPRTGDVAAAAILLAERQLTEAGAPGSLLLIADGIPEGEVEQLTGNSDWAGVPIQILAMTRDAGRLADLEKNATDALSGELVMPTPDGADVADIAAGVTKSFAAVAPGDGGDRRRDAGYWLVPVLVLVGILWWRPGFSVRWLGSFLLVASAVSAGCGSEPGDGLFRRADQESRRLFDAGRYAEAAEATTDPLARGAALYRAGEFEQAADTFARSDRPEAIFNRGTALMLLRKYEDAVGQFEQALLLRPGWEDAEVNLEIARLRAERLKKEGGEMTGGALGADEIVVNEGGKQPGGGEETTEEAGGNGLTDEAMREIWLRNVKTDPGDFLKARFAIQLADREREGGGR